MIRALLVFRIYMIIGYVVSLILVGYICFKYLFPMFGQWIVDLNHKMRSNGQRNRQWLKKRKVAKEQRKIDDSLSNPHRRAFYR